MWFLHYISEGTHFRGSNKKLPNHLPNGTNTKLITFTVVVILLINIDTCHFSGIHRKTLTIDSQKKVCKKILANAALGITAEKTLTIDSQEKNGSNLAMTAP